MARLLIINADDLGYDPAVTRGILEAMRAGGVSSATFMVNTPFSEEAAEAARGLSIGLHLNFARNAPVGSAFPGALLSRGELDEGRAGELPPEVVEAETLAQLNRLEALLGRPATHIDVHKHLHRHPGVFEGLVLAARRRGLPVRSITPEMRAALRARGVHTNDHFIGDAGAEAYWSEAQFTREALSVPDGVTELMCHPGYAPERVKSGYAQQREGELAWFRQGERVRALLEGAGISLVDFSAVAR